MPNFGNWIKTQAFVNPVEKHSVQSQNPLSSTSKKNRLHEQNSTQSWLIQDSKIIPVGS
ncbi:hypothetical protein M595_5563 [Lyngbya aestuarii BL J]|uniref:Uncharacterized protein n=2 Tax=Lyngbya aestuarii TaxID=118322 RepID=U7QCR1_9CYAN|nr:hypothetical protein M595_5563 [Lyngbya aestuarii BL J]